MGSRTRDYIGDEPQFRAVLVRPDGTVRYAGPYRTIGPAKSAVTAFVNQTGQWYDEEGRTGYVETAEPVWTRVE